MFKLKSLMTRQSFSAVSCKYLHNYNKNLCKSLQKNIFQDVEGISHK